MEDTPEHRKTLYLIKGVRAGDAHPILSTDVVLRNKRQKAETCLILDLNILADMEDVVVGRSTLEKTGLDKAVSILNSTLGLVLVPGLGFGEVSTHNLAARLATYEAFLKTYCPTYRDAPNSTMGSLRGRLKDGVLRTAFKDLDEQEQYVIAPLYASMLKTSLLVLDSGRLPAEKFFDLVRFHCNELDYITLIPLELAKYVFCELDRIRHPALREFAGKLRGVLLKKKPRTAQALCRQSFNAAFDLFYYFVSACASSPHLAIDGQRQDSWLLTGDAGMACLADAIYYDAAWPEMTAARLGAVPNRLDYAYFRQCDGIVLKAGATRRHIFAQRARGGDPDYSAIVNKCLAAIERCEGEAAALLGG